MLTLALTLLTISCPFRVFFHSFVTYTPSSSAIANQESLSGLEVEMRKLEGIVKEIVDEMGYLEEREERFANTNSACHPAHNGCQYSY